MREGLATEDWHSEIKRTLETAGAAAKPVTLFLDQYKMIDEAMYDDV